MEKSITTAGVVCPDGVGSAPMESDVLSQLLVATHVDPSRKVAAHVDIGLSLTHSIKCDAGMIHGSPYAHYHQEQPASSRGWAVTRAWS